MRRIGNVVAAASIFVCAIGSHVASAGAAERVDVFPSGTSLPVNVLRISLAFAEPHAAHVLPRVALRFADGAAVGRAFLDQELWTPDGRTLTLLFDPGRVKTGTLAHARFGYALTVGKTVRLLLDGDVLKSWRVGAEQRVAPDPRAWIVAPPAAGTCAPLRIDLRRPIDVMGARSIVTIGPDGTAVAGRPTLTAAESRWSFRPATPWTRGHYRLVVDPHLEDAEGNAIAGPLERHAASASDHAPSPRPISVPFIVTLR